MSDGPATIREHCIWPTGLILIFKIMPNTQATDGVTLDSNVTGVCCVVCGTIDYQMNSILVHSVAKCSEIIV